MSASLRNTAIVLAALIGLANAPCLLAGELRAQCYDGIDNDKDGLIDGADPDCGATTGPEPKELKVYLASMQNQIDSLISQVNSLNSQISVMQDEIQSIQASGGAGSNPALAYMNVVTIDGVPNVVFSGANVRIQSNGLTGRGNLIIGPNDGCTVCARSGRDNLIVGPNNEWKSIGGVVFGQNNAIDASWGSILGGAYNTISTAGTGGAIVTGTQNFVMTSYGAILGGKQNETSNWGAWGAVLGGQGQRATDYNYQTKYNY